MYQRAQATVKGKSSRTSLTQINRDPIAPSPAVQRSNEHEALEKVSWISQGYLPMKLGWYNTFGTDSDEVSVRDHLDLIVALVLRSHAPREQER